MRVERVLVSIGHPYGEAGVVADEDGGLWLAGLLEHPGTMIEGFAPVRAGVEDRLVHGGRLPPGATVAVLIDAAGREHGAALGNGAWVAVTEDLGLAEDFPVRFTGEGGAVIARPSEPGWERRALEDAVDGCAACGGRAWDVATRPDPEGGPASRKVVCRRCGHEVHVGAFVHVAADEGWEEAPVDPRAFDEEQRRREEHTLRAVDFPVYAVRGRAAELDGWSLSGRTATSVAVVHGERGEGMWVSVETENEEFFRHSEAAAARAALEVTFDPGPWPKLSESALSLWLRSRLREQMLAVARAELTRRELPVDGERVPFTAVARGARWAAVGRLGSHRSITLVAEGIPIDGLELVALDDPLSLLPPAP